MRLSQTVSVLTLFLFGAPHVLQALLEHESIGLLLVSPLLSTMTLAAPFLPSFGGLPAAATPVPPQGAAATFGLASFPDLVDVLLGWWLEPAATQHHRFAKESAASPNHFLTFLLGSSICCSSLPPSPRLYSLTPSIRLLLSSHSKHPPYFIL